jgi:8-oxo-dGTP pyrophosphatase MutT (NUDIX family)
LRATLVAYAPSGGRERAALRDILECLERVEAPFERSTRPGHITGSGVVLASDADAVLLVWHRKFGRWLQPGGHVQAGDASVLDTAVRETREETGLTAVTAPLGDTVLHVDVHEVCATRAEGAHRHFDIRYLLVAPCGQGRVVGPVGAEREVGGVAWFEPTALGRIATDDSLRRAVDRARRALRGGSPWVR